MSKKGDLMRVGDLVITHKAYNPTQHYICKIIDIVDRKGNSYNEYNVITGWGDLNSKVEYDLLIIGISTESKILIEEVNDGELIRKKTHDVYLRSANYNINNIEKKIIDYNKNIEFYKKNRRLEDIRDEKLSLIL